MATRFDPPRSGLALLAMLFAVIGLTAANADHAMAGWSIVAQVFGVQALVAAGLALVPGSAQWSGRRRAGSFWFAVGSIFLAGPLVLLTMARASCGCGDVVATSTTGADHALPAILGMAAQTWVQIALFAVPAFIGAAALFGGGARTVRSVEDRPIHHPAG